jgi:hypothetical protein
LFFRLISGSVRWFTGEFWWERQKINSLRPDRMEVPGLASVIFVYAARIRLLSFAR